MPERPSTLHVLHDLASGGRVHRYGPGRQQLAELRLPPGAGPHPAAVVVHGGYWRARYTRRTTRPLCAELTRQGWATWNIEYCRLGRRQGGGWPATFLDVAAAVDALADAAPDSVDLERVAAIGHSAGGHLALWAATRSDLPDGAPGARPRVQIAAVAALAAVCDLEAAPALTRPGEPVHALMGGTPDELPDAYSLANPRRRLPLGIPVMLVHGDADGTVPLRRSQQFAEAARAAGDEVAFTVVPGADHRAVADPRTEAVKPTVDWLSRLGWRSGAATAVPARPPGPVG